MFGGQYGDRALDRRCRLSATLGYRCSVATRACSFAYDVGGFEDQHVKIMQYSQEIVRFGRPVSLCPGLCSVAITNLQVFIAQKPKKLRGID